VTSSYSNAWQIMKERFVELLLLSIIAVVLSIPTAGLDAPDDIPWFFAYMMFGFSLTYSVFIFWPLEYGIATVFLRAVRGEKVQLGDMLEVTKNYFNAVMANILVGVIVGIGLVACIVPGVIFACKLAFVPYLIVDRKMDVVEAMKESWRMTTGHLGNLVLIVLAAIPVFIVGFLLFFVGIIFSSMLVALAFACFYSAVERADTEKAIAPSGSTETPEKAE
jgi:uncharacterized membrane protein